MSEKNIEIKFVTTWLENDIVQLYKAGGWWKEAWGPSGIKTLIECSVAVAVAGGCSSGKAVGMGRLISEGVSDAYIQDLVVLPRYRSQGVGKQIVATLLDYCLSRGISWIGLIAEPGNEDFFRDMGFRVMKDYVPMIYTKEED
jgi:ribosomal protein S18 acetylase RimI-like enzyme